jgi:hypothetical protein
MEARLDSRRMRKIEKRHDGKKSKHSLKINQTTEAQNTMIEHNNKRIINHAIVCLKTFFHSG